MPIVFKFGGASIKDAASFENVARIVANYASESPVLVVSALGKTTNALETVVQAYMEGNTQAAFERLASVRAQHETIVHQLFSDTDADDLLATLGDFFVDAEWVLETEVRGEYDYVYDQIVSLGELLSTQILAHLLTQRFQLPAVWLDARDCVRTDNTYRDAQVDWQTTERQIRSAMVRIGAGKITLTQGFIGSTDENFTTTLGREGSDYTAAIFAYCLDAERLVIWKDVAGILTTDPNLYPQRAVLLPRLSYAEAIEMTFFGAKVIHPNTLRPLQNKGIALNVRSFLKPTEAGTVISADVPTDEPYPPVIVVKERQALLRLRSRAFEFIDERRFSELFALLAQARIKVNMIQNTALAFSLVVDDKPARIEQFAQSISAQFSAEIRHNLRLLTLRHAPSSLQGELVGDRATYLYEHWGQHTQLLVDED